MKWLLIFLVTPALASQKNPFYGCPENSLCTTKQGEQWEQWKKYLKKWKQKPEYLFSKYGLALLHWSYHPPKTKAHPISWDSKCGHHRNSRPPIMKSQTLFKKTDKLAKNQSFAPYWRLDDKGKISAYRLPLNISVTSFSGQKLKGLWEEEGQFFELSFETNQSINVSIARKNSFPAVEEIPCPEPLKKLELSQMDQKIYRERFCRKVWDTKTKKYTTLMQLWTCP